MRTKLIVITVILLVFSTDAQQKPKENKSTPKESEIIKDSILEDTPIPSTKIDSLNQNLNSKIEPILRNDNIIEKKISDYIEVNTKFNKQVIATYEKTVKESAGKDEQIDSLIELVENRVQIDSVCIKWNFLSKRNDSNCKEWKITIK